MRERRESGKDKKGLWVKTREKLFPFEFHQAFETGFYMKVIVTVVWLNPFVLSKAFIFPPQELYLHTQETISEQVQWFSMSHLLCSRERWVRE
jgi:hypothetical protein